MCLESSVEFTREGRQVDQENQGRVQEKTTPRKVKSEKREREIGIKAGGQTRRKMLEGRPRMQQAQGNERPRAKNAH
eukprot:1214083-Pleurochrysis_carterae.AAC.3